MNHHIIPNRHLDITRPTPLDFQRRARIRDTFVADILAGAVINLLIGLLDYIHDDDETAAGLQFAADRRSLRKSICCRFPGFNNLRLLRSFA